MVVLVERETVHTGIDTERLADGDTSALPHARLYSLVIALLVLVTLRLDIFFDVVLLLVLMIIDATVAEHLAILFSARVGHVLHLAAEARLLDLDLEAVTVLPLLIIQVLLHVRVAALILLSVLVEVVISEAVVRLFLVLIVELVEVEAARLIGLAKARQVAQARHILLFGSDVAGATVRVVSLLLALLLFDVSGVLTTVLDLTGVLNAGRRWRLVNETLLLLLVALEVRSHLVRAAGHFVRAG